MSNKYPIPSAFTWLQLPTLPAVPEQFITLAQDLYQRNSNRLIQHLMSPSTDYYVNRDLNHDAGTSKSNVTVRLSMGDEWESWIKNNISPNYYDTSLRITLHSDRSRYGPHCDMPGKIRLMYLIDSGGSNVETIWYIKPGQPMVVDVDLWNETHKEPPHYNNINELIEIDRACLPTNTWISFNGYVLHGVENISGTLMFLDISFGADKIDFGLVCV
jgi:hypothetical protein